MLEIHPAAELFPEMPEAELKQLSADIKSRGLREPIILEDGKILDGRNRYRACQMANITPDCVEWNGKGESPITFVLSMNLRRRHLDAGQRAAIAAEATKLYEADAESRRFGNLKRGASPDGAKLPHRESGRSVEKASKAVGVSASSTKAFVRLKKRRPDLAARVVAGEMALNAAEKLAEAGDGQNRELGAPIVHVLDDNGGRVPKHLHDVFGDQSDFDAIGSLFTQIKKRAKQLADRTSGVRMQFNELAIAIDNARRQVLFARPAAVCPKCGGSGKPCDPCKQTGWLTKAELERVPKDQAT